MTKKKKRYNPKAEKLTPEERLDKLESRIRQGKVAPCGQIPGPFERATADPRVKKKAETLERLCKSKGGASGVLVRMRTYAPLSVIFIAVAILLLK
ncbi:MAG: hypothetical protein AAFZ35_14385 [Cyanobacteria bacterium J06649_12]